MFKKTQNSLDSIYIYIMVIGRVPIIQYEGELYENSWEVFCEKVG